MGSPHFPSVPRTLVSILTSSSLSDEPANHAATTVPLSRGRTVEAWQESVGFSVNIHSFSAETIIFLGFVSTAEGLLSSGLEGTVVEPLLSPDAGFVMSAAGVVFVGPLLTEGAAEMTSVPLVAGSVVSGAAVVSSAAGAVAASVLMSDAAVVSLPSLPLLSEAQAANDRIIRTAMAKAKNLFISQISVGSRFFPAIRSFRCFEAADIHYLRHISGNGDRQPPFIS